MIQNSRWLSGPEFLTKEEYLWPQDPSHHQMELSTDDPELKQDVQTYIQTPISPILLLRKAFAWLLRFKNWLARKHRRLSSNSSHSMSQHPSRFVSEVQVAERVILRHVQKLSFPDVVEALQRMTGSQESSRQVKPGLES